MEHGNAGTVSSGSALYSDSGFDPYANPKPDPLVVQIADTHANSNEYAHSYLYNYSHTDVNTDQNPDAYADGHCH